jgi:hypothetical protein
MRAGKWADVWFVILEDGYAVVNDEKVTMFDHMGDAIKAIQKIGVQQKKTVTEETLEEKLSADDDAGVWISDFVKSTDPRFEGKSKKERIKMALGAYYAAQNEDLEESITKKQASAITAAQIDALKNAMKSINDKKATADYYDNYDAQARNYHNKRLKEIPNEINKLRSKLLGEGVQLDEEVDYYKFKQLAILGLLSPGDANKAALGMKAIEGGHPPTQEQKKIIGDTLVLLVSMITGDSAILNKLKKTARDAKTPAA